MSKKKVNFTEITKYVPTYSIADKYYAFLKEIFPRGWITDVKAIHIKEYDTTKIYVCIKLDAYEKIRETKVYGTRIDNVLSRLFGKGLEDYEKRDKFTLEDMIFGERLKSWLDEWSNEMTNLYLIDLEYNYPYADGSSTYYSAKERKIFHTKEPPTRTKEVNEYEEAYKLNPCSVFKTKEIVSPSKKNIVMELRGYKYGKLIATHCFDSIRKLGHNYESEHDIQMSESQISIVDSINSCGGLLFPSVAISDIPATQFGFNVMVLNTELLRGWFEKKPKVSKTLPYYIYNTDGFTGTTSGYFGDFSKHLYNECYEGFDMMYENLSLYGYQNFEIDNGKFVSKFDLPKSEDSGIKVVTTERELARALNRKREVMTKCLKYMNRKDISDEDAHKYFRNLGHDKYWLSEVKFSRVLDINCFVMCVCPDYMYKNTKMFLDRIGFTGMIVTIELEDSLRKKMMGSQYLSKTENEYAILVREKILEMSKKMDADYSMRIVENGNVVRTDEKMWREIVKEVKAGNKGGNPGQWSARKAQLAVSIYKSRGGDYVGSKDKDNSLVRWTNQKWRTKSGLKSSVTGERYLPEKAIKALSDSEYQETSKIKRLGMKQGKQFVPQPKEIARKVKRYR